ncbi:D-alanyl-D-alanine carboxypeptidase, partial [Arthrobacter deserti]|nr:D-alanyl-D-alanine carboxypeptidase [Arthrobacter deserti]
PPAQQVPARLSAPGPVSTLTDSAPMPDPKTLSVVLDKALAYDGAGSFTGTVAGAATGQVLYNRAGQEPRVPASNMKLLTAAAALSVLGPEERFATSVLRGSRPGTLVLQGGGDCLLTAGESGTGSARTGGLAHAGLATLAGAAEKKLEAEDFGGTVTILVDDTAYAGPVISPGWDP